MLVSLPISLYLITANSKNQETKAQKSHLKIMEKQSPSLLLLLLLLTITTVCATPTPSPSSTPAGTQQQDDHQLNNIIDALIGSGDFNSWKNLIADADPTTFPLSATFFVPSRESRLLALDSFIFPYHIVPQRLSFFDLRLLRPFSRLPTLLPGKTILITNSSANNFTLDDSRLSYPDLYLTSTIAVHGVQNFLDYSVYGGNSTLFQTQSLSPPPPPPPPLQSPSLGFFVEEGVVTGGGNTSASAACSCPLMLFLVIFMLFVFKILWGPFRFFLIEITTTDYRGEVECLCKIWFLA